MEDRHQKALGQVVKVLAHRQDIVVLTTGTRVQPPSLHARTETTYGVALW